MGCDEFATEPIMCSLEMRAGITITIMDKATGAKVTGSTITLQDGDYFETLTTTSAGAAGWWKGFIGGATAAGGGWGSHLLVSHVRAS